MAVRELWRGVCGAVPCVILGLVLLLPGRAKGQDAPLRAGSARVDITPKVPVALGGYAGRKGLSRGVHDRLFARVVAFEQNGHRLVLVSTDLLGLYGSTSETIRQTILSACHLEASELFLAAIHTHSGPSVGIDERRSMPGNIAYVKELGPTLAMAVEQALKHMIPARIGNGSGWSPVGVNRRQAVTDRSGKMRIVLGRNPTAMTDREVQVLVIRPVDVNQPTTLLFAYPTHSTSMGPGNLLISGDVHGLAEQFVEAHLDHGLIAAGLAGASGDIDPWFRVLPGFKTEAGWVPEPVLLGTMLGEEVVKVATSVQATSDRGPIRTAFKTLTLPGKPEREEGIAPTGSTRSLNVAVGRVGDIAFVGLGCEAFNAIGTAIKRGSPFPHALVFTHCNGAAGYLPIREAYKDGGYEVESSRFAPEAADQVVKEVLNLLHGL
ncbi:MAG: neutral/alkaline non-lysosomal ceramidase N-terminal domain-containing protein [Isosphaeraceae bacterium]